MPSFADLLKTDSVPLVGLGILGLALPFLFPALRPQFAMLAKSSAKLFLEAEIGADSALTDRLVDAAVDALVGASSHGSDEHRKEHAEREIDRFVAAASAAAERRGWDEQDTKRRYHRHLAKLDSALSHARHRAHPSQRTALDHAHDMLTRHAPQPRSLTVQRTAQNLKAHVKVPPNRAKKSG
jgi:hypothetical protein